MTITGVQPGSTIMLMANDTYALNFSTSNFTLKQPGQCGTAASTSTSTLFANFSLCPVATFGGNHQLTVSLHLESGAQVVGTGNAPAEATTSVVVTSGTVPGGDR